jgi:cytoskeletal protein CcmA (bactofilin family)
MGIFGRDERTPESKPATQQPTKTPMPSGPPTATGRTIISGANTLEGTVAGPGDVQVDGRITGAVDITGNLLVADHGVVEGKIKARSVTVAGSVKGDITGIERIELQPSSKVEGNITAPRILINDGATFDGKVFMKDPGKHTSGSGQGANITTSSARRTEIKNDEQPEGDTKEDTKDQTPSS